jgi:dihydrofolate synthase/folylpolyglutamate synthase
MSTMTKPRRFGELDEWLAWFTTLHPKVIDMSLDRVLAVLATLGIARPPYKVVTVAGTNGKGSCVALLERIYLEAGFAVGAFTSPHLLRFNERIRCRGRDLDDAELVELFALIDEALGEQTLSYFEASAVAALLAFARLGADIAVLEVGMGGRLDAVNAVDADCALIVSIDLDHMDYLGPTRDLIGREKAGIARAGRPAVVADPDPPAGLLAEIERRGGELRLIGRDFGAEADDRGLLYWSGAGGERCRKRYPRPGFGGRIQVGNAAAVVAVVEALWAALPVDEAALRASSDRRDRVDLRRRPQSGGRRAVRRGPARAAARRAHARRLRRDARQGFEGRARALHGSRRRLVRRRDRFRSRR